MIEKINIKKNMVFLIMLLGFIFVYITRFVYLDNSIVSYPDYEVPLTTQNDILEQTWQPEVKWISGVEFSYYSENTFECNVHLKIFSDDYSEVLVDLVQENYTFHENSGGIIDIDFDRIGVIPGERYRFQISLEDCVGRGTIWVAAGSNYGGCSIDGEDAGAAVALTVTFAKFSKLFWLVAVFFPFCSYSFLAMCMAGKKFEETVTLSIIAEGLILYCFGLCEKLVLGINIVYLLAIICLIIGVYIYNRRGLTLKELISPGLIIYFIFVIIIILVNNGEWLAKRDDMRHWGIAVRDMYYYDSFAKHASTTVILPRYLPFTALIEYVFVYMNGFFSEEILLISYQIMMLSTVIIFSRSLQNRCNGVRIVSVLVAMVAVPVIFYNDISSIIMVDPLQMMILAYCILCFYLEPLFVYNMARILCAMVALTLIKDIGLVLAAIVAFIMFGDAFIGQLRRRKICIKETVFPIVGAAVVLSCYFGWQMYLSIPSDIQVEAEIVETIEVTDVEVEIAETIEMADGERDSGVDNAITASGISVEGIKKILSGEGEEYQYIITTNYLTELFDGETYQIGSIKISFVDLLLVVAFIIITLTYLRVWDYDKIRMYSFAGISVVASLILCLFLQVTYWFMFGMYEAMDLTSMDRYLASYICALIMVVFYMIYDQTYPENGCKNKEYMVYLLTFFLLISMPVNRILIKNNEVEGYATEDVIYGHDQLTEILRSVAKRGEKVQFICSGSGGYSEYVFRNSICPIISEHSNWNIVASKELYNQQAKKYADNGEYYSCGIVSEEDFASQLRGCKYLVLFHIDQEFMESYSAILERDCELQNGSVYKIVSEGDKIHLEWIGTTGIKSWS